jgi:hypothetical protein
MPNLVTEEEIKMAENELMHYGIIGQKWGIRRYQNEDGSLTALGREHYGLKNLSQINRDIHSDKGNEQAVRERERMYSKINKVEKKDYRQVTLDALKKYGLNNSAEKERYLTTRRKAIAEEALAAKLEVDQYLNFKFRDTAVSNIKDDDVERGRKAVAKAEAQTNRILLSIGGAMAIAGLIKYVNSKKKSGGA